MAYNGREAGRLKKFCKAGITDVIPPFASAQNIKRIQISFPYRLLNGRRLRAIVVDDSPTIRDLIARLFKELDYQVETAENGFEGYKALFNALSPIL